MEETR